MTTDVEARLREALHARAEEVEPDPHTWELVQERLRRARRRRLALAGAGAVAVVVALGLTVPALLGGTLIRFDGAVVDQPADDAPADREDSSTVQGGEDARPAPAPDTTQDAVDERAQREEEAREAREEVERLTAVEQARRRIQALAAAGDVTSLGELMAPDFTYSFGHEPDRDAAVAYLRENRALLERLHDLLEVPYGQVGSEGEVLYVWPRAHALEPSEWTEQDRAALRSLGAVDEQIADWEAAEGYTGLRAGITADGRWQFLVAGD